MEAGPVRPDGDRADDGVVGAVEDRAGRRGHVGARRDRLEIPRHQLTGPAGVDVADDDQGRVVGDVIGPAEGGDLGLGERHQPVSRSEQRPAVEVVREEQGVEGGEGPEERVGGLAASVGLEQVGPCPLDGRRGQGQGPHAVRFEPQGQSQIVGGQGLVEQGLVHGRRRVELAADLLHEADVLEGRDVLRALEHEVLEEVGQSFLAGLLPQRPGAVGHGHRHQREPGVLGQDDAEAVAQAVVLDAEGRRGGGGGLGRNPRGRGEGEGEKDEESGRSLHAWRTILLPHEGQQ